MIRNQFYDLVDYEGYYEINMLGEVRRKGKKNILSLKKENSGYIRVHLSKKGKSKLELVHRLVAKMFIPNPTNHKTVNHKDENKQNNFVGNLEWVDMSYQNSYGIGAINRNKAKEKPILQYDKCGVFIKRWESITQAAKHLNLSISSISAVCRKARRYKSTGGYVFKYEQN